MVPKEIIRISEQAHAILTALRAVTYARIIIKHNEIGQPFWVSCSNVNLEHFVIGWSKLFGNKDSEDLHWKHSFPDQAAFKLGLFKAVCKNQDEFLIYNRQLLRLRNSLFAHTQIEREPLPLPGLDPAIEAMKYLRVQLWYAHDLACKNSSRINADPIPNMDLFLSNLQSEANTYIPEALSATKQFPQVR